MNENDCCFTSGNNWFRYRSGAIIIEDNCVLFAGSKSIEYLYTIGGAVNLGEKAEDCVKREVFEETGVEYEIDRLVMICENFFKGKGGIIDKKDCHVIEFYFLMKSRGSKELHSNSINAEKEKEIMHWIPLDDLQNYNIKPSFLKERLPEIIKSKGILHLVTEKDK